MKYLMLDHCSIMFRAWYAMRKICLENNNLQPAINVYSKWTRTIKNRFQADINLSIYDIDNSTSTNAAIYNKYKAGRHVDALFKNNIHQFEQTDKDNQFGMIGFKGYEADDVIASLIAQGTSEQDKIIVISSDKDLLQLVNNKTTVYSQLIGSKLKQWTSEVVNKKFDLDNPLQIADLKAFIGDNSDGYFGVKGIGKKTAIKLLHKYHSFNNVYQAIDANDQSFQKSTKKKLVEDRKNGFVCYQLAKLDLNAELDPKNNYFYDR